MIPYEELVAALRSWRERNGLPVGSSGLVTPSVPPLAPPGADPLSAGHMSDLAPDLADDAGVDQVYDLSDDSGLIEAEVQPEDAEFPEDGAYDADHAGGYDLGEDRGYAADAHDDGDYGAAPHADDAPSYFQEEADYAAEGEAAFDPSATHEAAADEETFINDQGAAAYYDDVGDEAIVAEQEEYEDGFDDVPSLNDDEATQIHRAATTTYGDDAEAEAHLVSAGDVVDEVEEHDPHRNDPWPHGDHDGEE